MRGVRSVVKTVLIAAMHHESTLSMERTPFTFQDGVNAMQASANEYAHEIADYPGDICLFGHNHLQFFGKVADSSTFMALGLLAYYN